MTCQLFIHELSNNVYKWIDCRATCCISVSFMLPMVVCIFCFVIHSGMIQVYHRLSINWSHLTFCCNKVIHLCIVLLFIENFIPISQAIHPYYYKETSTHVSHWLHLITSCLVWIMYKKHLGLFHLVLIAYRSLFPLLCNCSAYCHFNVNSQVIGFFFSDFLF